MPIVLGKDAGLFYQVNPNHNWAIVLHCVNPRLDEYLLAFFMTVLHHTYTVFNYECLLFLGKDVLRFNANNS